MRTRRRKNAHRRTAAAAAATTGGKKKAQASVPANRARTERAARRGAIDPDNPVRSGVTLNASVVPAVLAGRKKYESRGAPIQPGYYALYCSNYTKALMLDFIKAVPAEEPYMAESMSVIAQLNKKIAGVLVVGKMFDHTAPGPFPASPYASAQRFAHEITVIPFRDPDEYIASDLKSGQVSLTPAVKLKLNDLVRAYRRENNEPV